jgi:hypothetical protein
MFGCDLLCEGCARCLKAQLQFLGGETEGRHAEAPDN